MRRASARTLATATPRHKPRPDRARLDPKKTARPETGFRSFPQGLSGADLLSSEDFKDVAACIHMDLLTQAAEARHDIFKFFSFVMKNFAQMTDGGLATDREVASRDIIVAPHQRVMIEFIQHHDRVAIMAPIGFAKTFTLVGLTLFNMGHHPDMRGAIVSASDDIAKRSLKVIRDYIETSQALRLVFPNLRKSKRSSDAWTDSAITVDRPAGIKDATLSAYGVDTRRILGSRLNWIVIDDLLDEENTYTVDARKKLSNWLNMSVLSRRDPTGSKVVFINTPWHPDDAICEVAKQWATLRFDAFGDIEVSNDAEDERSPDFVAWDSTELRPSTKAANDNRCRLVAHDPDPDNHVVLWPERLPLEKLQAEQRRLIVAPHLFDRMYRCRARSDEMAMCKQEYINTCLQVARDRGHHQFLYEYHGPNPTFTGLDLAVSPKDGADETAFFTFMVTPEGLNVILDIDIGHFSAPDTLDKLFDKQRRYGSIVRIENNGFQLSIRQFALKRSLSIPVKAHNTGIAKAHPEYGVARLFTEMHNGGWAFPNHPRQGQHPFMSRFIQSCLNYVPSAHTADELMAAYFGLEQRIAIMGSGGYGNEQGQAAGASPMDR